MKILIAITLVLLWLTVRAVQGQLSDRSILYRILLDLDIFICAIALGSTDMTISSRCGLAIRNGTPLRHLGRMLNRISKNHCELAIMDDIQRAESAIEVLNGQVRP